MTQSSAATEIVLRPATVAKWVAAAIVLIVGLSVAGQVVRFGLGYDNLLGLVPFTYVDAEGNLPTWYSVTALLACALVTATIAAVKFEARDAYAWHWWLLAAIFAFLSLDEAAEVHEMIGRAVRGRTWVAIATPFVLGLSIVYLRFLWSLPRTIRALLLLGGGVFLLGAMGFELIGNRYRWTVGGGNITYVTIATIEELLEMTGVAIVLYALLEYARRTIGAVTVRFDAQEPARGARGGEGSTVGGPSPAAYRTPVEAAEQAVPR